jgi:hypothetical protein
MYNSIQHFNEFGVKRIEKTVKNFIKDGKDLADLILELKEDLFKLGRDILDVPGHNKLALKNRNKRTLK